MPIPASSSARRRRPAPVPTCPNLIDPALPPGVVHGRQHRDIGIEPNQQRRRLIVMLDDERRTAFLQRLEDRIEVAGEFGSGNDFEHDAIVDRLSTMVKQESMRGVMISAIAKRAAIGVILIATAACQQIPAASNATTPTASPSSTA